MDLGYELRRLTWYRLLRRLRKLGGRRPALPELPPFDLTGQAASDRIRALLEAPSPCMVSRFGGVEMRAVLNYVSIHQPGGWLARLRHYLGGQAGPWWWDATTRRQMLHQAGFFPVDGAHLERFAERFLLDCREVDLMGSLAPEEQLIPTPQRPCRIPFPDLEPYRHREPWSAALAGRKVLVVHPFASSVESQYRKRAALFRDPRVLPEFQLQVLPAVQSLGGDCPAFPDWFAALAAMERAMAVVDFEVAIIGAGAYGMALAAYAKRDLGRKALHLGGATQILFGIRGRRWDQWPEYSRDLYNEAWVSPLPEERPAAAVRVEDACYW